MEHLLPSFVRSAAGAGATAPAADLEAAGMDLLRRWSEPHRRYHDVEHLGEVLQHLGELGCDDPAVLLAAWFHDAVYAGAPGRDEQDSADLAGAALPVLGVPGPTTDRVHALVLVTADHVPPAGDAGAAALCDADLAVLASEAGRYRRYAAAVRAEHPGLDDATFAAGRGRVLRRLLDRQPLFGTEAGRHRWEQRARANVRRELADLTG